jgi:hypothetical protein
VRESVEGGGEDGSNYDTELYDFTLLPLLLSVIYSAGARRAKTRSFNGKNITFVGKPSGKQPLRD